MGQSIGSLPKKKSWTSCEAPPTNKYHGFISGVLALVANPTIVLGIKFHATNGKAQHAPRGAWFFLFGFGGCGVRFFSFIVAIECGNATIIDHITRENNYFKPIH
jgi:hypothetical protein